MDVDYILVGAGSAGCVLAARLTENPHTRVLLLEAGGENDGFWRKIPVGYAKSYYDPSVNWMLESEPEPGLKGRRVYVPRGKGLGGSGAINAMIYVRGAPEDFDDWGALGLPGWSAADVAPVFQRMESSDLRGGSGPIGVRSMRPGAHPVSRAFLAGCRELGLPESMDFNAGPFEGAGVYEINVRRGLRSSSGAEYLAKARGRGNLRVLTHARAVRVVIEEGRAVGVEYLHDGGRHIARAKGEVVLCAGAVHTPQLLMLSGVGDGAALQSLGLETRLHAPQVGRNLQDHLCASFYYKSKIPTLNGPFSSLFGKAAMGLRWLALRSGPLAESVNQAGGFFKGHAGLKRPNVQLYFNPLSYRIPAVKGAGLTPEPYPGFLLAFNACRPMSRGEIALASPDPLAAPLIRPRFLSHPQDEDEAIQGCRLVRRIMEAPALRAVTVAEMEPFVGLKSDAALLEAFRENCGSIYHLCGTAAMGAVLDEGLRVRGVERLRVADASAFPLIPSGNINAPTMMLGERAAEFIQNQ